VTWNVGLLLWIFPLGLDRFVDNSAFWGKGKIWAAEHRFYLRKALRTSDQEVADLDGYTEKVESGSQGVQHILKRHLLSDSQDKPPAAPHQVNVHLVGTGHCVPYDLPVSPRIFNIGKGQGAFGIRKQPVDCRLVTVIHFHLAPRSEQVIG
jgi:hypothetical protein